MNVGDRSLRSSFDLEEPLPELAVLLSDPPPLTTDTYLAVCCTDGTTHIVHAQAVGSRWGHASTLPPHLGPLAPLGALGQAGSQGKGWASCANWLLAGRSSLSLFGRSRSRSRSCSSRMSRMCRLVTLTCPTCMAGPAGWPSWLA